MYPSFEKNRRFYNECRVFLEHLESLGLADHLIPEDWDRAVNITRWRYENSKNKKKPQDRDMRYLISYPVRSLTNEQKWSDFDGLNINGTLLDRKDCVLMVEQAKQEKGTW